MKKIFRKRLQSRKLSKLITFGVSAAFSILTAQSAIAQVNLSQVPLFLKESVDPNLVFIFDDSGSMGWRFMPDDLSGRAGNNYYYSILISLLRVQR